MEQSPEEQIADGMTATSAGLVVSDSSPSGYGRCPDDSARLRRTRGRPVRFRPKCQSFV